MKSESLIRLKPTNPFQALNLVDRKILALWVFSAAVLFFAAMSLDLLENEAFYWTWAKRPALGYLSHPPLQAWITALSTGIFGDYPGSVRAPLLPFRLIGLYFYYHWARERYDDRTAVLGSALLVWAPIMNAAGFVAFPDSFMLPLVAMAMYFSERGRWLPMGTALGLACLAKWFSVLLIPGCVAALALSSEDRVSARKKIIKAGLLVFAIQLPVIIWNSQHEWAGVWMQLVSRHDRPPLTMLQMAKHFGNFVVGQLAVGGMSMAAFYMFAGRHARLGHFDRRRAGPSIWVWVLPTALVFFVSALLGQFRIYWTWPAFVPLIFALSASAGIASSRLRRLCWWSAAMLGLQAALIFTAFHIPFGKQRGSVTRTLASPGAGWNEWNALLLKQGQIDSRTGFIASDFHVASQVAWMTRTFEPGLIQVAGNQNQFRYWAEHPTDRKQRFLLVGDDRYRGVNEFANLCAHPLRWEIFPVYLHGWRIKEIYWALCTKLSS